MFTHVNLILSDAMPEKAGFLYNLAEAINNRLRNQERLDRVFVRLILSSGLGSGQSAAMLKVIGHESLLHEDLEALKSLLLCCLNEKYVINQYFLYYSFSEHDRVLAGV